MIFPRQQLYKVNFLGFIADYIKKIFFKDSQEDYKIAKLSFQKKFKDEYNLENVIPTTAGRVAFYYSVKYSVNKEKNKIIVCPFTIFDMINMIELAGGKPIFVDSEPGKTSINIDEFNKIISSRSDVAAILITHYHTLDKNFYKVKKICGELNIKIIEDCAIALGSKKNFYDSDYVFFSFGIFKFISTFIGGALYVKSKNERNLINLELDSRDIIKPSDYTIFFFKALKFKIVLNKFFFNIFVFPILKFGYNRDIKLIKNLVKNDPKPFSRKKLDGYMKKRLSPFQMREFLRQHKNLQKNKVKRFENYLFYFNNLQNLKNISIPDSPDKISDCYLTFPILTTKKNFFLSHLINSGHDVSEYFYRNCSNLEIFKKYQSTNLNNINSVSENVLLLPCYPNISKKYMLELVNKIKIIDQLNF